MSRGPGGPIHRGAIGPMSLLETNCKAFTEFHSVNYKLDRASNEFKVLNDRRAQGQECSIHAGDILMSFSNDMVDRDQEPRVFAHTGAVALETTSTDKRVQRREFWRNVRTVGFARTTVTYDAATSCPRSNGQVAAVFGGVLSVMNSGKEDIRVRNWVIAQLPDRADTKRPRQTLETVGVDPRNIPRLLDEIDLTHLLGTKAFKDAVRDAVMFVQRVVTSIHIAAGKDFTDRATGAPVNYAGADVNDKSKVYPDYTKGQLEAIAEIMMSSREPQNQEELNLCKKFASTAVLFPHKDLGGDDPEAKAEWDKHSKLVVDSFSERLKHSATTPDEKEATAFLVGNTPFSAHIMGCIFSRVQGIALEDSKAGYPFDINATCPHGHMMQQITDL